MKIQNYFFLSLFSLAGLMHCLCSSRLINKIEEEQAWYQPVFREPNRSFNNIH